MQYAMPELFFATTLPAWAMCWPQKSPARSQATPGAILSVSASSWATGVGRRAINGGEEPPITVTGRSALCP